MRLLLLLISGVSLFMTAHGQPGKADPWLKLWYTRPAAAWEEALPLGNGKTGAMVFGGVENERYQLNDNTLWSGYPDAGNNPNGPGLLPQVRQMVFQGNYDSAAVLWKKMQGPYSARYLPLADLELLFPVYDTATTNYSRELDLNTALSTVKYNTVAAYRRECFTSYPDKVMVIRITTDKKAAINFSIALTSKLNYTTTAVAANYLLLKGKAPKFVAHRPIEPQQIIYDASPAGEGMNFQVHVKVKTEGGTVKQLKDQLSVSGADAVTIYLTEATSFNGFDRSPGLAGKDPGIEAAANLANAFQKTYARLKEAHIKDYQSLFNRVQLNLGVADAVVRLPTDQRLKQYAAAKNDHQLQAMY
jgi:alpha-L-fucosidase 2